MRREGNTAQQRHSLSVAKFCAFLKDVKINFVSALREAGAIVEHVFVNFYYDIFPESKKTLADLGVQLHSLATWWDVLAVVKKDGYLPPAQIAEVEKFLHEPAKWSAAHGGVSSFPSA